MAYDIAAVIPVRDDPLLELAVESVPEGMPIIIALTRPSATARLVAQRMAGTRSDVTVLETDTIGMSAGVNLGVSECPVEKIIILDSDCRLASGAAEAFSEGLDGSNFVRGTVLVDQTTPWSKIAWHGQAELNRKAGDKARLIGPGIAVRRTPFLKLGGYDEQIMGSCDHEFALRVEDAGIDTVYAPDAQVHHQALTLRIDCRAHLGYGAGMIMIDSKRGGRYGLGICTLRLKPATLVRKARERGPMSVIRSLLLGVLMVYGYVRDKDGRAARRRHG